MAINPYNSFPIGWDNIDIPLPDHIRDLFTESAQPASDAFNFGTSYQAHLRNGIANDPQPNDTFEENVEAPEQLALTVVRAQPETASSRRAKSQHLDWDTHKHTIKSFYIDQNKSLPETMQAMDEQYSFKAS